MRKIILLAVLLLMAGVGTQAPEFAQQYRQRLAGAVAELQTIVRDFDALAARFGLEREQALAAFSETNSDFLAEHGLNLSQIITRYERLNGQLKQLEQTSVALRPLAVLRSGDGDIVAATWSDYRPAAPLGQEGWLYGGLSALLGLFGFKGAGRIVRRKA